MEQFTFDLQKWTARYPVDSFRHSVNLISWHGPCHFSLREQVFARASAAGNLGPTCPVDVFVLAFGEPERRDITKMGGLPYRPSGLEWPRSQESGDPLAFVAQFRFRESRDIISNNLPEDVLLCFFEDTWGSADGSEFSGPPVLEWFPLGIDDLVESHEIPVSRCEVPPPCYGLRYRTVDYRDPCAATAFMEALPAAIAASFDSEMADYEARLWALKIGGLPYWSESKQATEERELGGAFLATIPTIRGNNEGPYPWANCEHEVWDGSFVWAVDGLVHLYLDDNGTVQPRMQRF